MHPKFFPPSYKVFLISFFLFNKMSHLLLVLLSSSHFLFGIDHQHLHLNMCSYSYVLNEDERLRRRFPVGDLHVSRSSSALDLGRLEDWERG